MKKDSKDLKLNLQFFADDEGASEPNKAGEAGEINTQDPSKKTAVPNKGGINNAVKPKEEKAASAEPGNENKKDEESLENLGIQEIMNKYVKVKHALDKAASEAAEYRRKYKDTLSTKEQADMEKAEAAAARDAEFEELKRKVAITELEKQFIGLGYGEELATKAATAQYDGETTTLFNIQKQVMSDLIEKERQDWIKSRPDVNIGSGGDEEDAFLKGFKSAGSIYRR